MRRQSTHQPTIDVTDIGDSSISLLSANRLHQRGLSSKLIKMWAARRMRPALEYYYMVTHMQKAQVFCRWDYLQIVITKPPCGKRRNCALSRPLCNDWCAAPCSVNAPATRGLVCVYTSTSKQIVVVWPHLNTHQTTTQPHLYSKSTPMVLPFNGSI